MEGAQRNGAEGRRQVATIGESVPLVHIGANDNGPKLRRLVGVCRGPDDEPGYLMRSPAVEVGATAVGRESWRHNRKGEGRDTIIVAYIEPENERAAKMV